MIKTISYLGLGTMGNGMASNLLKVGYEVTVWNRSAEKCEPFARRARVADTPADAVRDVDLVMYSISNDQAVRKSSLARKFSANQGRPDRNRHEHGSTRDEFARTGSLRKARRRFSRCTCLAADKPRMPSSGSWPGDKAILKK
jgi:3-hydroxyisobutyrate dehydrogenase-like beta-hydroxyacid dehydrogenase